MKSFEEIKTYIVEFATNKGACNTQLRRAKNASNVDELLIVVKDNIGWTIENKLFSPQKMEEYFGKEKMIEFNLANTGDDNTGFSNTGDSNTGDRNTGYRNTGYRNTGNWNTEDAPFPMFNKPSNWTEQDFLNSKAYNLMVNYVDTKQWVPEYAMNEEEKTAHPSYKTAEGYLKDIPFKEAFKNAWGNWNEENRAVFTSLPNFDAEVFESITGVKI